MIRTRRSGQEYTGYMSLLQIFYGVHLIKFYSRDICRLGNETHTLPPDWDESEAVMMMMVVFIIMQKNT